ncbi:MAG TPA: phosphatidate cytidylyltransferase [Thermoanaerobaculia bacterium]|nr:phosphatidate cytidylyltransferase [Thermoanaerobaculia bacterium]
MRLQREITAAVLIPAVLAVLVFAPTWAFSLLVAAAATVALLEFYALLSAAGWDVPRAAGVVLFLGLLAAAHLGHSRAVVAFAGATVVVLPALVMFAKPPVAALLPSSAGAVFATLYVALGGGAIIGLRAAGWENVLFLLAVVWAGDSAAYYAGRRWGKRRLAPTVSPKKTWEGFYGQLGGGAVFGALGGFFLASLPRSAPAVPDSGPQVAQALALGALLGILISIVAVVGDLVESTFKRSVAVKDSGGLLPGHGGLLDRLDSLLYASPVLLLVLTLFPGGRR